MAVDDEVRAAMQVTVHFYSYFKDLTGCQTLTETVPDGSTLEQLLAQLVKRFPSLARAQNSMLLVVGLDYQDRRYVLKPGDEVSLFPPVQGG